MQTPPKKEKYSSCYLLIGVLAVVFAVAVTALLWMNRDQLIGSQTDLTDQTANTATGLLPNTPLGQAGLECNGYSLYKGKFVEDGSDEEVEDVAAILITNRSGKFLDLATLTYDIDGETAVFVVTGLPNGQSAWVLESERKTARADSVFTCTDVVPGYRSDAVASIDGLQISKGVGLITATNNSDAVMKDVFVLYKVVNTDGNYLGGITYKINIGDLEPGQTVEKLSAHFSPDAKIVRIAQNTESSP